MNAWSELPNASHIDWIIESVKQNPQLWREAWLEARAPSRYGAFDAAMWSARREAIQAARNATREVARDAVLALVIYDDCDQYINMGYEKLQVYAILSEKPQAVFLLPMVYVREKLNEQALV